MDAVAQLDRATAFHIAPQRGEPRRVLIVGTGERAVRLARALSRQGVMVVGAIDDAPQPQLALCSPAVPWLGGLDQLIDATVLGHVEELFVALPLRSGFDAWIRARAAARQLGIPVTLEFDLIDELDRTCFLPGISHVAAIHYSRHPSQVGVARLAKRAIDVAVSLTALTLLAPVFAATALAVGLTSPGPVIFRQNRVGLSRRHFRMLKFRTMDADAERKSADLPTLDPHGIMFKAEADPRVTRVGAWLRRTSLDELPQLINVLNGDMSLVGPRPMPTWVYDRVRAPEFHRRSSVLPGMTGLWQVKGRVQNVERLTSDDLDYVDRWSLRRDAAILLKTPLAVLRGTGAQ